MIGFERSQQQSALDASSQQQSQQQLEEKIKFAVAVAVRQQQMQRQHQQTVAAADEHSNRNCFENGLNSGASSMVASPVSSTNSMITSIAGTAATKSAASKSSPTNASKSNSNKRAAKDTLSLLQRQMQQSQRRPAPNLFDFFPEINQNGFKLTWQHNANSQSELLLALASNKLVVSARVSLAEASRYPVPIMAKPSSALGLPDFALESYLQEFVAANARKAIKLSFTSTRTVEPAFRVLAKHYDSLNVPLILDASIASWQPSSTDVAPAAAANSQQPVDAWTFLMLCRTRFPKSIISIGWCKPATENSFAASSPVSETQIVGQKPPVPVVGIDNQQQQQLESSSSSLGSSSESLHELDLPVGSATGGCRKQLVQPSAAHQQLNSLSQQIQSALARQQRQSVVAGFVGPMKKSLSSHNSLKLQSHPYAILEPLQAAHSSHLQQRLSLLGNSPQLSHQFDAYVSSHSSCGSLNLSNHRQINSQHFGNLFDHQSSLANLSSANSLNSSSGNSSASPSPTSPSPLIASAQNLQQQQTLTDCATGSNINSRDCYSLYTHEMIDKMASIVREYNLTQPVTFPVKAKLIRNSVDELKRLLQQVGVNASLTVVANENDLTTVSDILLILKAFPKHQLMFDLPEELVTAVLQQHQHLQQ